MSTPPQFTVLIPARLRSTRLPNKPLADIHGIPMVVRVAQQAKKSRAINVVVAGDDSTIVKACAAFGIDAILTRTDHLSGSDRLAEACDVLALADDHLVVNVQGDEPLIDPALIDAVAATLSVRPDCVMSSAAHSIGEFEEFLNPNVVKVVLDACQTALYFSRAPIPASRDNGNAVWWKSGTGAAAPLRHIGIYGYRASFLRHFPKLAASPAELTESLEQLRVLWHGHRIAIHISEVTPGIGVDTAQDLERIRSLF
jgi:3-deoxy-manno-octulosonate cytidylyltransferase (CMP-KDO synthetase)